MTLKKLFFDELQKQNDDIFFYYKIKIPTQPFFNYPLRVFFFVCFCQYSPFFSVYCPRDHNESKIHVDLYYAIPSSVSLDVEFLDAFDFILRKLC